MGGAFVAVANDSSATWWNPAGLASGPFLDLATARQSVGVDDALPARRDRASWFALATPPFGISYYRLRITDIRPLDPTGNSGVDRKENGAGVPVRSVSVSQLGITVVRTLVPGVHTGATLKYLRATPRFKHETGQLSAGDLLERGEDLENGDGDGAFDVDAGVLAVAGAFRIGVVMKNLRQPEFAAGAFTLPRQVRVGVALDAEAAGGTPFTLAVDADARVYTVATGDRRMLAFGAEHWFRARQVGVRAGVRANTVGAKDRAATAGVSLAVRSGLYVDGHVVRGGASDERGWGLATRVSF